ncbi:MAG: nicotinate (nicotinamide) nucleotide adenylyltransferase [Alistipes sp.]|nr:nicotinate (nicotinamide) nucleotide adenylyltransferase [Alistipes sp.]
MKRVLLYFGSFNPIHKGHIALAEYAIERGLCDSVALIVSPQNPLKEGDSLIAELHRFEMAEIACRESRFPEQIMPSAIEFLLPRPSYTIDTLRYLQENNGAEMEFSVLMGADIIPQLDRWKDYQELLDNYNINVYPRSGYTVDKYLDKITFLADAPLHDYSSTDIREAYAEGRDTSAMLSKGVAEYIAKNGLLKRSGRAAEVQSLITQAKAAYGRNEWGKALNEFNAALKLEPENREAQEYVKMIQEILEFRYKDIYNP